MALQVRVWLDIPTSAQLPDSVETRYVCSLDRSVHLFDWMGVWTNEY
jgi:hypothetical protein